MAKSPIMSKLFILIFVPALLLGQPGREIVLFGTVQGQVDESETIPLAFVQIDVISGTAFHAQDMTDGSGYYEFSATWGEDDWPFFHSAQVSASPDGYISQEQTVDFSSWPVELNFVLLPDENPTPYGWITGTVTAQLSETGPVLLYPGAVITAEPGWAGPDNVTGFTDDLGAFELELQASELPWTIICSTAFGDQEFEVLIDPDSGMIQNFHFNAWEYPTLPPAQNLSATLSEDETMTFLSWDTQEEWPGICDANFTVLANVMNDPSEDWFVIGETEDLEFIHIIDLPDEFPIDICYRVHTFCGVLEALPSLVDCVQNYEIPFPPAPYGLSAFYDPGQGLGGAAVLSWLYPELPDPEMIPIFNVYANLGSWSGYEFIFIEQTDEQTYVYQFGDFAEPDNENCFRITAQIDEQESEPCSSQCVYLEEEPTGEGHFYGEVYTVDETGEEMIAGAVIQGIDVQSGDTFITESLENGFYNLAVAPGEYDVNCTTPEGESQQRRLIIEGEQNINLDFWFGDFPEAYILSGTVEGILASGDIFPLSDAELLANQNGIYIDANSGNGTYSMGLPFQGIWSIKAEASGFETVTAVVNIGPDVNEQNFLLTPLDDLFPVFLTAAEITGVLDEILEILLTIEVPEPVSVFGFRIVDQPDWLIAENIVSHLDCYNLNYNDTDFGLEIFYSPGPDCVLETGTHHFATVYYTADEPAQFGQSVNLVFEAATAADQYDNPLPVISTNGRVYFQMLGDPNGDGHTNVLDVVLMVNYILGSDQPDDYQFWSADINADGMLDILDIVLLVGIVLEG